MPYSTQHNCMHAFAYTLDLENHNTYKEKLQASQENINENSGIFTIRVSHLNGELFIAQSE